MLRNIEQRVRGIEQRAREHHEHSLGYISFGSQIHGEPGSPRGLQIQDELYDGYLILLVLISCVWSLVLRVARLLRYISSESTRHMLQVLHIP